jgi:hypothetical protein
MSLARYLVLFDADRIKDYVFATGRLKEIRGASEQVRRLTDEEHLLKSDLAGTHGLAGWDDQQALARIIYASGGAGALLFKAQDPKRCEQAAMAFCRDLERQYRQVTGSATLSAIAVAIADDTIQSEQAAQQTAARALARRKSARQQAELVPGGSLLRFCASDRLRPAATSVHDPDGPGLLVSLPTANKRMLSKEYRSQVRQQPYWHNFERRLRERQREDWLEAIHDNQDLGSIGVQARPAGYVALVYIDGDSVGKLIKAVVAERGFAGYRAISTALQSAAETATAEALADAYNSRAPLRLPDPRRGYRSRNLPFEVITIGGDDVILVCTAEQGLAIACAISKIYSEQINNYLQSPELQSVATFTASAAVVIAHDSLPIVQLERRSRELLKNAKREKPGPRIDFHIVSTPALDQIDLLRKRDYSAAGVTYTRRPYLLAEAEWLLAHARRLRGLANHDHVPRASLKQSDDPAKDETRDLLELPGSKRADLYQACRGDRIQATIDVLTVHRRLPAATRNALLAALCVLQSVAYFPFGAPEDGVFATALPDLLEILEFVAEEGRWEPLP